MAGLGAVTLASAPRSMNASGMKTVESSGIRIDPTPRFELSPWLYMQFMEPLGVTDGSVEAAWDHSKDRWREDVIEVTRELAPGMIRYGGIFSAYYRWKEGVGPRSQRKPMLNIHWNGIETNQVGTAEFVDFCRQVNADPLMTVNFESEGNEHWARTLKGENRSGDAKEAAEWVDYCNNPSNKLRIDHGFREPLKINTWQIGNETSYDRDRFDVKTAAQKTVEFSRAMKDVDPSIAIIGWGDSGWGPEMIERAGEHFDYIAFHHMYDPGHVLGYDYLRDNDYREDPAATWEALMEAYKPHEKKIRNVREEVAGTNMPLALTECHYALPGRNRCEVLSSWAAGVSYARLMNLHERNGDLLKIATLADFCGTRWQVNAIMIPVPGGKSFMMPVARIMHLYRHHTGKKALHIYHKLGDLDITASRTDDTIYLHVVNTSRKRTIITPIEIDNLTVSSAKAFEISADPEFEILRAENNPLIPKERVLQVQEPVAFPPASVTAIELKVTLNDAWSRQF